MSLIPTPPAPVTPAQQNANQIRQMVANLFTQMGGTNQRVYTMFWLDPINIAAALGTDAADLFRLGGVCVTALNAASPGAVPSNLQGPPPGYTATPNDDGSVTITTPAQVTNGN